MDLMVIIITIHYHIASNPDLKASCRPTCPQVGLRCVRSTTNSQRRIILIEFLGVQRRTEGAFVLHSPGRGFASLTSKSAALGSRSASNAFPIPCKHGGVAAMLAGNRKVGDDH